MTSQNREFFDKILRAGGKRELSRRQFITHASAAGLAVPAAATLWSQNVSAQTPERGGKFRVGVHDGNTSDTHDPGNYSSVGSIQLAHTHRSYLTEITATNDLGPDMANEWSATPDAKTWTFKLAENASFHSGKPFTAKDAIASLNFHRGEESTSAAKSLLASV
ncbi:ABC transporter substrate-binding protein, partial [Gammaproteobacteria bacterium]|nr:ABC transporter substrate-binding protein [Gammaproteobacteria bacterium]